MSLPHILVDPLTDYEWILKSKIRSATFHLYTVWLFTYSDLKTIAVPATLFGLCNAYSASAYMLEPPTLHQLLVRAPLVSIWVYMTLLPFDMVNQVSAEAIREDALNKPWRPLPAGRIGCRSVLVLIFILYPTALVLSFCCGGLSQNIVLILLGYLYNSLGGADYSWGVRNALNGLGFINFLSGAMDVALGGYRVPAAWKWDQPTAHWFLTIATVVFTTVQTQDLYDQVGDAKRGRLTMPLQLGDATARRVTVFFVLVWSIICPGLWGAKPLIGMIPVTLGTVVAIRIMLWRSVEADKKSFRLWNIWLASLYALPLCRNTSYD